ncbi:MAG: hypothetical protein HY738_06280 [Bacteroidia bacterium]|nr:hypothetical protein [Bacteroidia bacterium]
MKKLIPLLIFAFFVIFPANQTKAQVLEQDSLALVALYNSTDGDNWFNNTNWLTGQVSTWHGITISENRVIRITIWGNNLTGTISSELGNLDSLERIYLYNNLLTGSIPSELGNLSNLLVLQLHNNQLTGPIPPELGNLFN